MLIEPNHPQLSVSRQCELLALPRSSYYYKPGQESEENLWLMRWLDQRYTERPCLGTRKLIRELARLGMTVNRKRIRRLRGLMGLETLYPKPRRLSQPGQDHKIYPYLLRHLDIVRPNQVWASDITYIALPRGFMYLVAILDWYSRFVLSWELSNTLETEFCLCALERALERSRPEIFNSDQGSQFTSLAFTGRLEDSSIRISMDGRGRVFDNIFVERLWRSLKYEDLYLKDYQTVPSLYRGLQSYLFYYNYERLHQSLAYRTPYEVYCEQ